MSDLFNFFKSRISFVLRPENYKRCKKLKAPLQILFAFYTLLCLPLSHSLLVNKILIQGNKIIETDMIRSHIQLKKDAPYDKNIVHKDFHRLFALGFFDDISIHRFKAERGRLNILYKFKERVYISEIEFKGNKKLNTEELKKLSLVQEHSFLDPDKLKKTILAIKEKYRGKAYYLAKASYKVIQSSKTKGTPAYKKHKLLIEITENSKLLIKRIHFIGNRNIPSQKLKSFMKSREKSLLSFFSSAGLYQPEDIERDRQAIEYYYRDQGYLNVRTASPEINITPDKKFLYINFSISEGPRFKMGEALFKGDELVSSEEVSDKLKLKKQDYFSLSLLQKDIQFISLLYKNKGYAFVRVQPVFYPDRNEEDKIHILFKVEKGRAYKLGRIKLFGNQNTRDKVIFRRFRLQEGELYNESQKELSHQLLQQLGYFEKVEIKPVPNEKTKDELDLSVHIKERENTGEAHLAAGYNSFYGLFIRGGVKKQNFLGLDQSVAFNLTFSRVDESFFVNYHNPYFLDSRWNFAFDIFNVSRDNFTGGSSSVLPFQSSGAFSSYFQRNTGFSISLGRHLTNFLTVFLKYKLQYQLLKKEPVYVLRNLPVLKPLFNFLFKDKKSQQKNQTEVQETEGQKQKKINKLSEIKKLGENTEFIKINNEVKGVSPIFNDIFNLDEASGLNSSLSVILEYDKRNDRYYASKGLFLRLSAEYSGLGGDFKWTKLQGRFNHYYSPFWKLVIKNRLELGSVFSSDEVPFTEFFLLGGPYNLRGFPINSQGPKKYSKQAHAYAIWEELDYPESFAKQPVGGENMFFYSLELEFPIVERAELRGAFFFDLGEANNTLQFDPNDQLRADVGLGLRWRSPFGPLSLDWAFPYHPKKEHREKDWELQFNIGSQF